MISKELLLENCEKIGISLDSAACDKFDLYARLLIAYNEKVNLTAITAPDDIVNKHFADSLWLCRFVNISDKMRLCDVGTGAGFPGVPLLIYKPTLALTLFDSVNKKLDFIRFLLGELDLTAEVVTARAEQAGREKPFRESFELVTARAVARLNLLSEYCLPLVKPGGVFAPLKAPLSADEKKEGERAAAKLGGGEANSQVYELLGGDRREIIIFKKNKSTPITYPRNSAQISKKPL